MYLSEILFFFFFFVFLRSQVEEEEKYFNLNHIINNESVSFIDKGDSLIIELKGITVKGSLVPENFDRKYYLQIKNWVYKVYPFYSETLDEYYSILDENLSRKDRKGKKIIKQKQKDLNNKYKDDIKRKLSKNNARMFAKMTYRETGKTAYEVIKELKGGWSAFWWETKAKAFNIDLKNTYNPQLYREDSYIEYVLQEGFKNGSLKKFKK